MEAGAHADHRIIEMKDTVRGAGKCGLSGADFVAWPESFRPLAPPEAGQRRTRVELIQYKPRPPPSLLRLLFIVEHGTAALEHLRLQLLVIEEQPRLCQTTFESNIILSTQKKMTEKHQPGLRSTP